MKRLGIAALLLAVPLVCAALTASVTYAWNSFTASPPPAYATGASVERSQEGYAVTTVKVGDVEYMVVSSYAKYENEKKEELKSTPRHFITIYEIARKGEGKAELILVGSRCVEWDRGYELIGFKPDNSSPEKVRGMRD